MLALDRAIIAWLRRHHVPLDVALMAAGGVVVWMLSMTITTYQQFYFSTRAWLPGVAVGIALLVGLVAGVAARRSEVSGSPERAMAVLARVAVVGAVLLLQMAPMQLNA